MLTALVLLAACALVTTALVQRLLGERPVLSYDAVAARVHDTSWNELPVLVGGGAAVLAGCTLLAAALFRGRPAVLALTREPAEINAGTPRHGLERSLRAAAASVDGVAGAKVRSGRRRIRVKVRTNRTNRSGLAAAVRATVQERLDRVGLAEVPEVRVRVRGGRR
ncbi:DUF6286 domain-containing protein [Amycolatopsis sp. CA-128772]|uniref:DUF6286 domain-containing protein n=1 Tax=Amycolatopsis sp. CA-128772 TaxID=2073159 RepID=UPI001E28508B|nr:DUF6286 domain-containing protein [Amycolatopsis sp. CA-128772]